MDGAAGYLLGWQTGCEGCALHCIQAACWLIHFWSAGHQQSHAQYSKIKVQHVLALMELTVAGESIGLQTSVIMSADGWHLSLTRLACCRAAA